MAINRAPERFRIKPPRQLSDSPDDAEAVRVAIQLAEAAADAEALAAVSAADEPRAGGAVGAAPRAEVE